MSLLELLIAAKNKFLCFKIVLFRVRNGRDLSMEINLEVYRRSAERRSRRAMNVDLSGTNLRLKEPSEYLRFHSGREN